MKANYEKFFSMLAETHRAVSVTALFKTVDYCDNPTKMRDRVRALAKRVEEDLAKRQHTWQVQRFTSRENGQLYYRLVRRQLAKAA